MSDPNLTQTAAANSTQISASTPTPTLIYAAVRQEDLIVKLAPTHQIYEMVDRVVEYQSAKEFEILLFGLFAGSVMGVIGNWATSELITRTSIILLIILAIFTVLCMVRMIMVNRKANIQKLKLESMRNNQNNLVQISTTIGLIGTAPAPTPIGQGIPTAKPANQSSLPTA